MVTVMISVPASIAIYTLLGLLANWMIIFFFWRPYSIDAFRQDLYELRAELFNLATQQEIPFSNSEYRLLEHRIDCMIRWAPRLTLIHFLLAYFVVASDSSRLEGPFWGPLLKDPLDQPRDDVRRRGELVAINHWLLLRAFFQALHVPAVFLRFGRIAWGHALPASPSAQEIEHAIDILERRRLLDPVRLLVREALVLTREQGA